MTCASSPGPGNPFSIGCGVLVAISTFAPSPAASQPLAGVLVPHVLQHLQARRDVLQLLAGLAADARPRFAAAGALPLLVGEIVDDLDARQVVRQLPPAVLVVVDPASLQRLAALGLDDGGIDGHLLGDVHAEQQQLSRIELLRARSIEAAEDCVHLRLVPLLHRLDAFGRLTLDLIDRGVPLRDHAVTLRDPACDRPA